MNRKKTIYHFRGHKVKDATEIPKKAHWSVIVQSSVNIGLSGVEPHHPVPDVKPDPSSVDVIDYYVFKDNEQDKMQELVNLFYNEDPQRKDVRINKVTPLEHEVRFVVDIEKPQPKPVVEEKVEKVEEVKENAPDVANE